jgi:transposase
MRATRDLLRRRTHLMRQRAALLAHVQKTTSQYTLPARGKKIASQATRDGVAERFAEAAVQKSIEVDVALITSDDQLLGDGERSSVKAATHHDANTLDLLPTVPGIGKSLSLVRLDEIHDMDRFPRVQDFVCSCRLIKCAKEAAGKRLGTAGKKIGTAHLKWAVSEAAALFLRHNPDGQRRLARLEQRHDQGQALPLLAHQLARAVYDRLKRNMAFAMDKFRHRSGSRAGEPDASLDTPRDPPQSSGLEGLVDGVAERQGTPRPFIPEPCPLIGLPLWLHRKGDSRPS